MTTLATEALERYIAEQTVARGVVTFDEIIFANIPNLTADRLRNHLYMPSSQHIVHRQAISQSGVVNENAVVYSVTMGTEVGDFDFNFIGLVNRSKNLLAIAVYTDTIRKIRNQQGIQGNSITRSILLEFKGAQSLTNLNVNANTWQIDFTVRLKGLDEKIRLTNRDLYGRAIFFDDGFKVTRGSGNQYFVEVGSGYIEGVRADNQTQQSLTVRTLPCSIYLDIVHHNTVTGTYQTDNTFLQVSKNDWLDSSHNQHYVQILADIDSNGVVMDRRILSPLLGVKPKDLNEESISEKDHSGHSHRLPLASLIKKGIVKLYSGVDSDAEDMAATPKVIKRLKDLIDAIIRNYGNFISNSKKSNSVTSTSSDTVATSYAVNAAYNKAISVEKANLFQKIYIPTIEHLDLTNRESIIALFGDKYRSNGYLTISTGAASTGSGKGLPLDAKAAVNLTFYLVGAHSFIFCDYVSLNRRFFTSVNFNIPTLELDWQEILTLGQDGKVPRLTTFKQGIKIESLNPTDWPVLRVGVAQGEWRLAFNPDSHELTKRQFNFVYSNGDDSASVIFPTISAKSERVAYQSWVSDKLNNYINNNRKSNSVSLDSEDYVATSKALKLAYETAVEAKGYALKRNTVKILTGTLEHGGTIPLPSGFEERECRWFVSIKNSNPGNRTWDINEYRAKNHFKLECWTEGRQVHAQMVRENSGRNDVQNMFASYIIIGVK